MKSPKDFSHLLQSHPRTQAQAVARQMTSSYHRAIGVSEQDDAGRSTDAETPEPKKREQSDADKAVDEMRRAYNRANGLPENDGIEHSESDSETHQDKV